MKTLYFDCFCGASGDMILGALIDAGLPFDELREALATFKVEGYALSAKKVDKHGTSATKFDVELDPNLKQPHRHLRHIVEIIDSGALPEIVKDASKETFRRIAECEAQVHSTTVEKVHFHEVGAVDSIIDIIGAHWALNRLGIERIDASPLHVGYGTVTAAHGVMPVPAPATALLLRGAPVYGGDVEGELVTPTGAALVTQLAKRFGPMPPMTVEAVGYGAGTKDLSDRANVLRVAIGETAGVVRGREPITIVEANIDDMGGEFFPPLVAGLIDAGARDAFIAPIIGKKGRPAQLLTVLCDPGLEDTLAKFIFESASTLGVRIRTEERICLDRAWKTVSTPWGAVRVKSGSLNGTVLNWAPEFEDCAAAAANGKVAVKAVYESALAAAIKGEFCDE